MINRLSQKIHYEMQNNYTYSNTQKLFVHWKGNTWNNIIKITSVKTSLLQQNKYGNKFLIFFLEF